jgi:hypothetical protein
MQTRGRRPLPSQPPLRSNSNAGNVIYRKPSVVRSRDGSPGTIRQGTRTKKQKQSDGIIYLTSHSGIRKAKQLGLVSNAASGSPEIKRDIDKGKIISLPSHSDKFITGRVSGELNVVSNQHMVNKKLVNKDGKLNPTLQGWESRNLTSGRTKRQLNQGANFGMPIFYHPSVFDTVLYELRMKELKKPNVRQSRV